MWFFKPCEQQDYGCPDISGRGQVCRPVHDQDQEAEHPYQAPAQDSNAQGVPQDQPSIFDADRSASLLPTICSHGSANDPMQPVSGMSSPQDSLYIVREEIHGSVLQYFDYINVKDTQTRSSSTTTPSTTLTRIQVEGAIRCWRRPCTC